MNASVNPTEAVDALQQALLWCGQNPIVVGAIGVLVVAVLVVRRIAAAQPISLDQQRMFSSSQRAEAKRRAGGRCEHSFAGMRCRRPGEHADHIYPHSRGGATAMSNCQSLCQSHNLSKSAKVPSRFYIARLAARRRSYFPPGVPVEVEYRLGVAK